MQTLSNIATGSSYGALVKDQHARQAVLNALKKMPACTVGSVLLFLSSGYAHNPQNALKEAARAAGTPQIFGCCAMGLLTDEDWLLDVEGAVAMVFPRESALQSLAVAEQNGFSPDWILTLASPNAANIAINAVNQPQFGALASDEFGHGPFSLWQSGRIVEREYSHTTLTSSCEHSIYKAESVRRISPIMRIDAAGDGYLVKIDDQTASENLLTHLPENLHAIGLQQPFNIIAAISENDECASIENGHYKLRHVVAIDQHSKRVQLSGSANKGRHMFWAMRDEQRARQVMHSQLLQAKQTLKNEPRFAMMFPNLSRGAEFYNGRDQDFELFKQVFPELPMIGFYGHGEIAPGHRDSTLIHHHSAVFSIFS